MSENPNQLRVIVGGQKELDWASAKLGISLWPHGSIALAGYFGDELRVVVVYNGFFDNSTCTMHIVTTEGRNWATRGALYAFFAYPFEQCGLRRVTAAIPERNIKSQIMALKLGFKFEGRLLHASQNDNELLLGMLREDCHWIEER